MRKIVAVILLLAVGGLLARTNPDEDAFRSWVRERVENRLASETGGGGLGRVLTDLGSVVAGSVASKTAERHDWLLFSVYTIDLGADDRSDEKWRFVGVAGSFFEVSTPESFR